MNTFSYIEYRNIIKLIEQYLPIKDFKDVLDYNLSRFCVLRHDIEFSIDRALILARLEKELEVTSTYTVQLRNNTYNALSQKNIETVQEIKKLGHNIGLHQNPPALISDKELIKYIQKDIETLEHYYGFEVDRFAFHRCGSNPKLLEKYVKVPNKINCYDEKFFHYFKGDKPKDFRVHYLADSNHLWKYGHPLYVDYTIYPFRMQLLTHPYSWSDIGYNNMPNFNRLIKERNDELITDMNTETTTFPQELL
jgi:hypothetical protein